MSPLGVPQTALKETSENTDFCYYIADRIAAYSIYICVYRHTDTYVYQLSPWGTCERSEYSYFSVIIYRPTRYTFCVITAATNIMTVTSAIKFSRGHRNHRSTVVLDRSDLIVIIVTRILKACYMA